jgi:mRNA interferase RelE/StbE
MPEYRIEFTASAYRAFGKLDPQVRKRLEPHISALASDPRPSGSKMLANAEALYRIRVGAYRIVYQIRDDVLVVLVLKLGHRRDVYRDR